MYRIYSALIEIVAAAVFIIPIWCIYNNRLTLSERTCLECNCATSAHRSMDTATEIICNNRST